MKCYICGREGHSQHKCQERCKNCKRMGHRTSRCPSRMCYKCSQMGYIATECKSEMSRRCWRCRGERSEAYLAKERKTIYYCLTCKEGTNDSGLQETANASRLPVEERRRQVPKEDRKLIKGRLANRVFTTQFDVMDNILNILKGNLYDGEGHHSFWNMCFVNRFLYQNFSEYWRRDNDAKLEHHKKIVNYIPGGDEAKKLGLTEVRCETCKNFRGSKS